jgi:hypothetical protein
LLERCLAHVQQPNSHPLPPAAATLDRPPAGRSSRRRWAAVAAVAVAGVALALPFWNASHGPIGADTDGELSASIGRAELFDDASAVETCAKLSWGESGRFIGMGPVT